MSTSGEVERLKSLSSTTQGWITSSSRPTPSSDGDIAAFFLRNGFDVETRAICDRFARDRFPRAVVEPAPRQGYCSYTLTVGDDEIIQFRPSTLQMDVDIIGEAKRILGDLVPRTRPFGLVKGVGLKDHDEPRSNELHVYLLDRVPGLSLDEIQSSYERDSRFLFRIKKSLMSDLGAVFAQTCLMGMTRAGDRDQSLRGKVGSSLALRLQMLQGFTSGDVKLAVDQVRGALSDIEQLPWCLTHGDMVPANVMVDPGSGRLRGLIDWAEGENLPFGVGLYGLEELLGTTTGDGRFEYHSNHEALRRQFWRGFLTHMQRQGIEADGVPWERVLLARKLGILLWRGIAFENGRIDRVVEAGVDDSELRKLHLFLSVDTAAAPGGGDRGIRKWFLRVAGSWNHHSRVLRMAMQVCRRVAERVGIMF